MSKPSRKPPLPPKPPIVRYRLRSTCWSNRYRNGRPVPWGREGEVVTHIRVVGLGVVEVRPAKGEPFTVFKDKLITVTD